MMPWLFYSHGSKLRVEVEISMRAICPRGGLRMGGMLLAAGFFVPSSTNARPRISPARGAAAV
jgi:hypothetical protein